MADYRKSLSDMTPEELQEVAPGAAAYKNIFGDRSEKPLSVKVVDEAVSLATPIDSIVEIQQELAKDEPDYLKIGMLGGMEAIGLLAPGAGKVAQSMIRKGADMARQTDNVVDVASNIPQVPRSVTPSYTDEALLEADDILAEWGKGNLTNPQLRKAMSDKGFKIETKTISPKMTADDIEVVGPDGNIVRWKDMPRGTGAIDTTKGSIEAAGLTDEAIDAWRKANATSEEFRKALKGRNPELQDLANKIDDPDSPITVEDYRVRADEIRPIRKVTDVPKPATYKEVVSALNAGKRKKPMIGLNAEIPDGDIITARLDIDAYTDYDVWVPTLTHPDLKTVYKPTVVLKDVSFIDESSSALKKAKGVAQGKAKAPFAVMTGKYQNMGNDEAYEYATSVFDSDEWVQAGYDPTKRGFFYDRADGQPILAGDEVIQVGHLVLVKNATKGDAKAFSFNEGGMAMDEQMDAVFKSSRTGYAEGGEVGAAPDTTIGVDPVSGNEVPMGATPEEVRDDIPAQLSEGEYVVPADVVRFYGVKFFEDLRTGAKQGYAEMDQNGRIGGEPVGPEGMEMIEPEDDLPFDISELQMVDDEEMPVGAAEGGYFERAINRETPYNNFEKLLQFLFKDKDEYGETPIDRYREQMGDDDMGFFESMMGNNFERGERKWGKKGYADGGEVTATPVPQNPFSPTGSTVGFEIKEYVNDAGEVMYIQFMNGQPMTFIPQGFKPKGTAAEEAAEEDTSVQATSAPSTASSDSGNDYDTGAEMGKVDPQFAGASATDWTKASVDDFASATSNLGSAGLIGGLAGALLPGPLGLVTGIGSQSQARIKAYDMLDGIAYQLESMDKNDPSYKALSEQKAKLQEIVKTSDDGKSDDGFLGSTKIYGGASSMYEGLTDQDGDGRVSFADTWLGDLLGADRNGPGVQGPGLTDSRGGARRDLETYGGAAYEGDATAAEKRAAERPVSKYQQQIDSGDYSGAAKTATNAWIAAGNAADAARKSGDMFAAHKAALAQSEASKAATKAIREASGWTGGFFGKATNPDWRDEDKDED